MDWENEFFEVKSINKVKGLFAKVDFSIGEQVCLIEGETISAPNRYSVQVSKTEHVNVKEPVMYINHNCDANLRLSGYVFIATKNIKIGDELVFNYLDSEDVLAEPFKCFRCHQNVKGKSFVEEFPCKLLTA